MASHSESELERIWNSFNHSQKQWIGEHCSFSDGLHCDYMEAIRNVGDGTKYQGQVFRNAILYVKNGHNGKLYTSGDGLKGERFTTFYDPY